MKNICELLISVRFWVGALCCLIAVLMGVLLISPSSPSSPLSLEDILVMNTLSSFPIESMKPVFGGAFDAGKCLIFKTALSSGREAAFKLGGCDEDYRAEIASFFMNRLLGSDRVPVAVERRIAITDIEIAARHEFSSISPSQIVAAEKFQTKLNSFLSTYRTQGQSEVVGVMIDWVDIESQDAAIYLERELSLTHGSWQHLLLHVHDNGMQKSDMSRIQYATSLVLSDMQVFDFIVDNRDRWSGSNVRKIRNKSFLEGLILLDQGEAFRITNQVASDATILPPHSLSWNAHEFSRPKSQRPFLVDPERWYAINLKTAVDVHLGKWIGSRAEDDIMCRFSVNLISKLVKLLRSDQEFHNINDLHSLVHGAAHGKIQRRLSASLIALLVENHQYSTALWFLDANPHPLLTNVDEYSDTPLNARGMLLDMRILRLMRQIDSCVTQHGIYNVLNDYQDREI